ncbi:MAG: PQQ-binding-like beta-propeller repeat protein, partial [Propionibacteriaceae bacterium]|nr:PQQ-binding-like beta-propeller repeat protein [Propionibacteriaceae bacterium]
NDDLLAGRDATVMTEVRGSAAGERLVRVEVRDSTLLPGCSVSLVTIPWADAERVVTLAWCRGRGLVGYGEGDRGENAMILPAPRPEPLLRSAVGVPGWPNGQVRSKVETEEVHRWLGSRESFAPTTIKLGAVLPNGLVLHAGDATVLGLRHGTDPEWATTRVWLEHRWRIVLDKEATALAGGPQGGAVTDSGGHLIVFQPEGGILWRHQLDDVASAVALDGSVVVARTLDGRVSAFDFASGARLWSTLIDAKTTGQKLAFRDGIVAILTRDSLTVLDGQTGRQLFEWSGIAPEATAVVEGRVVVVERALGVAAVDLDGRIAWQRNPGVVANGQLIVSDDRIVVVTASAATAFDLDGARVWQQPGQWNHGLAAAGGHVVLVGAGGSRLVGPDGVARGNWPGSTMVGALVVTPFGVYGQGVWQ